MSSLRREHSRRGQVLKRPVSLPPHRRSPKIDVALRASRHRQIPAPCVCRSSRMLRLRYAELDRCQSSRPYAIVRLAWCRSRSRGWHRQFTQYDATITTTSRNRPHRHPRSSAFRQLFQRSQHAVNGRLLADVGSRGHSHDPAPGFQRDYQFSASTYY